MRKHFFVIFLSFILSIACVTTTLPSTLMVVNAEDLTVLPESEIQNYVGKRVEQNVRFQVDGGESVIVNVNYINPKTDKEVFGDSGPATYPISLLKGQILKDYRSEDNKRIFDIYTRGDGKNPSFEIDENLDWDLENGKPVDSNTNDSKDVTFVYTDDDDNNKYNDSYSYVDCVGDSACSIHVRTATGFTGKGKQLSYTKTYVLNYRLIVDGVEKQSGELQSQRNENRSGPNFDTTVVDYSVKYLDDSWFSNDSNVKIEVSGAEKRDGSFERPFCETDLEELYKNHEEIPTDKYYVYAGTHGDNAERIVGSVNAIMIMPFTVYVNADLCNPEMHSSLKDGVHYGLRLCGEENQKGLAQYYFLQKGDFEKLIDNNVTDCSVDIENDKEEIFDNNIFTDSQKETDSQGFATAVRLMADELESDYVEQSMKDAVSQLENVNNVTYISMSLNATDQVTARNVTEFDKPITLSLKSNDISGDKDYVVIREHDGETDQLPVTFNQDNNSIEVETNKFSTYALVEVEKTKLHTVTWKNDDGKVLQQETDIAADEKPVYAKQTPVKESDEQFDYTFKDWIMEVNADTDDVTYTANYDKTLRKYVIQWVDDNSKVLKSEEVEYGQIPMFSADGKLPEKESDAKLSYSFAGWNKEVVAVKSDATYQATFTSKLNRYTVVWQDENGTELEKDENVEYGSQPGYDGVVPEKAGTKQYSFTFKGWNPSVSAVTGNITYTAVFEKKINKYLITWLNKDGVELKREEVEYGTVPKFSNNNSVPTYMNDDLYTFKGWSPLVTEVTGEQAYTASYEFHSMKKIQVSAGLSDAQISDELKETNLNTVEKINDKLLKTVQEKIGVTKDNTVLMDVELLVSDDGVNWDPATKDNFPKEGIEVTLPYPEGTNARDYDFTVVHMFGETLNGHVVGDIETPVVKETAEGLKVVLTGTSPVLIGYKRTEKKQDLPKDKKENKKTAPTGDSSNALVYICMALVAGLIAGLATKKRKHLS